MEADASEGNGQNPSLNSSEGQSQENTRQEAPAAAEGQQMTNRNTRTAGNTALGDNANVTNLGQ